MSCRATDEQVRELAEVYSLEDAEWQLSMSEEYGDDNVIDRWQRVVVLIKNRRN